MFENSSGDVFRDLGFSEGEAEDLRLRSDLLMRLQEKIASLNESQAVIATRLNVQQPRVSDLLRGKIDRFSLETLLGMLRKLGTGVSVVIDDERSSDDVSFEVQHCDIWTSADLNQNIKLSVPDTASAASAAPDNQYALAA